MLISRLAVKTVEQSLDRQAAVVLIGTRQVGKTTLALEVPQHRQSVYLDLENPDDRAKLNNPDLFLEPLKDHLVILDEVHRSPAIFESLRGLIDRGRREENVKDGF